METPAIYHSSTAQMTITLPQQVKTELEAHIPKRERSQFISQVVWEALHARAQDNVLKVMDNIPKYAVQERSEDVIAKIRAQRAARLHVRLH